MMKLRGFNLIPPNLACSGMARHHDTAAYSPQQQIDFLPHDIREPVLKQNRIIAGTPTPVPARSKAWVCDRSLAGIAGSNPAGASVSLFCERCVVR
jgi:hypothetical protein